MDKPYAADAGAATATAPTADRGAEPAQSPKALGRRVPLPAYGALVYAGIRAFGYAIAAILLPRGRFQHLHYSLWHLISSWDSGRYLIIAAHGYSYVPGDLRHDVIYAWFPGYPAAIDAVAWALGTAHAALAVTLVAGCAAAWGLTRLGMTLTGDRRVSLLMPALWGAAPGSIVLSMLYSEALFCALAVWALVALAERRWLTAAAFTIAAGTVRSAAIALIAAVAVAALAALLRAARASRASRASRAAPERRPFSGWWRPAAALLLSPLGMLGWWAYTAHALHRASGWFWIEGITRLSFDWGRSTAQAVRIAVIDGPTAAEALTLLVLAAAVTLTAFVLAERIPLGMKVYTLLVVAVAMCTGPDFFGSKPRFLLPAVLLALPAARLLAPMRAWLLIPLIAVLAAASTWFGIYIMTVGWAP